MRLLIDSDVLLDFIGERESTAAAWVKLHAMELAGAAALWVSAEAFGAVRAALAEDAYKRQARCRRCPSFRSGRGCAQARPPCPCG